MPLCDDIAEELRAREVPPLAPKNPWNADVSRRLQSDDAELFGAETALAAVPSGLTASTRCALCRAALLLWNDDLDGAHVLVQPLEDATAAAIHAIIHRREGDFPNALYWWRRAGSHPLLGLIGSTVSNIAGASEYSLLGRDEVFEAVLFTRLCERATTENDASLRRIQAAELEETFRFCRAQLL